MEIEIVFADKSQMPTSEDVERVLGERLPLLETLLNNCNIDESLWKFYSKKSGWTWQCRRKKLNLFYVQMVIGGFYVWITLGVKAKLKALELINNPVVCKAILSAKEYPEGTSFFVAVQNYADVEIVQRLIEIKLS
jgi:hypothetical protein